MFRRYGLHPHLALCLGTLHSLLTPQIKDPMGVIVIDTGLIGDTDGVNIQGALVWLAHLHGLSVQRLADLGLNSVSVVAVWEAIELWIVLEKHGGIQGLKPWFDAWYDSAVANNEMTSYLASMLTFPCQIFDHAVGFARVTKFLVYHAVGSIKDRKPKGIKLNTLHLASNDPLGKSTARISPDLLASEYR